MLGGTSPENRWRSLLELERLNWLASVAIRPARTIATTLPFETEHRHTVEPLICILILLEMAVAVLCRTLSVSALVHSTTFVSSFFLFLA